MKITDDPLRDQVAQRMAKLDLTAHRLAKESGVDATHLRDFLRGKKRMSTDRFSALLPVLKLDATLSELK
jgi:transcriptional regulator with XRE-family HTH domain